MKKIILFVCLATITLSCKSSKAVPPLDVLTVTAWELSALNGKKVSAESLPNGLPTAMFSKENKISGSSSCNTYSGSYNLNDDWGINVSEIIATRMYCEGSIENEYFKALEKANSAKIDNGQLTLMEGVEERLVFVPKK